MRLVTFRRVRSRDARVGLVLDNAVLDLREALIDMLSVNYGIADQDVVEWVYSFTSDMRRFIELLPITSELISRTIRFYSKIELHELVERGLACMASDIRYLPVVQNPSKVIGIGLNYEEFRVMLKYPKPEVPLFFFKPTNTLIGHEDTVYIPRGGRWPGTESKCLFHEYEMAVVIGRKARNISRGEVYNYIFGVTIFSDITAHDIEMIQPGFVLYQQRSKAFDTLSPVGPWIVSLDEVVEHSIDLHNLRIARRRNGVVEGESNTRNMIYRIPEVIEFLSEVMTLNPGDIISLGSPPGTSHCLQPGDVIEAEVEFIGTLRNHVK
ncbi:MAG: fumarylacetoacetate hydrolase family protein [Ignisphaera sp.]|nr:fumarylacetoacetate hydrolase family protein [Ignisphaera sp.]MDW8084757.1 fumarylacetoacetate hydrolase family protein [Ignisphaera sp.]